MTAIEADHIVVFRNCKLLRNHKLVCEDLWIGHGRVIDPADLFYYKNRTFDKEIDCKGALIAPGLIDLQVAKFVFK